MGKTPFTIDSLFIWLSDYQDREAANISTKGFTEGFRLHYQATDIHTYGRNLKSDVDH